MRIELLVLDCRFALLRDDVSFFFLVIVSVCVLCSFVLSFCPLSLSLFLSRSWFESIFLSVLSRDFLFKVLSLWYLLLRKTFESVS